MAFPTTSVLDDFNRADTGPPPSASWDSAALDFTTSALSVVSNTLKCASVAGGAWGATVGPDCEAYTTLSTPQADLQRLRLYLRAQQIGGSTLDGYMVEEQRSDGSSGGIFKIFRIDNDVNTTLGASVTDNGGVLAAGNIQGADVVVDTISGYINRGSWSTVLSRTDTTYSSSGQIGLGTTDSAARFDDFGGGTIASAAAPVSARPFDAIPFM